MTGPVLLLAALVATVLIAIALRWKNGRFSTPPVDERERLSASQIGAPLGERATLVQFSSAFCAPCRATRVLLTDIAAKVPGVVTVEIDAEEHLQLVRDLDIMRTPTVLVLDPSGVVTTRASGLPRRDQVLAALDRAVESPQ
jgi:thiol-disulfide isomerase/thioredoxin